MAESKLRILSGNANKKLAEEVSSKLKIPLTPVEIKRFSDGETYVRIQESIRGCTIFLVQPTCPPVNDNLMELLLICDALKRASAQEITAVVPYYGYARQDRKVMPREPISARLAADLMIKAGIHRIITFDLHKDQIEGFFDIPVDNLEVLPLLADYFLDKKLKNLVIVSPDAGGTARARHLAKLLNASLALIDKRRPRHDESEVLNVIGDVQGKDAIIIDDIIDTAGTITKAAQAIRAKGAKEIYVCATHAVLSDPAVERLKGNIIKEVVVTNSIPLPPEKRIPKIRIISIAGLMAESIKRIYEGRPMGVVFDRLYDTLNKKLKSLKTEIPKK